MLKYALDRALKLLPPSWAASLDLSLRPEIRWRWGGPMNGQDGRMAMVRSLIDALPIEQIVETGTSRAATTEWFATIFEGPIHTVELDRRNLLFSRSVLARFPQVTLCEADSHVWLDRMSHDNVVAGRRTLFYLDAHMTGVSQPVRSEIQTIVGRWPEYVIVVDDVALPDDPGYGGEHLGDGRILDVPYIAAALPDATALFVPTMPASRESGMKRGCCVITPAGEIATKIANLPLLRSANLNNSDTLQISK